ncbi:potassium-transporting ATPase subunit KdpC [Paenibacillus tengchongensis]|uniref:potassium-transporting ATPase subunit KdpC n=1 Tax=Paenibacillus tengchongensis TaxID=2608684 RepID=UPI00124E5E11|nr:potassium-transporting ATPase subunit KdpC [Paenibacillus tengchongensis]
MANLNTQPVPRSGISTASYLLSIVRLALIFIVLCGLVYPLVSTGLAQVLMPSQAGGSLLKDSGGKVIGSELIGQQFTDAALFQSRISSIGYKAEASGSNNYGPGNPDMLQRTADAVKEWQAANPQVPLSGLPVDLVTNSGSGLDPHISPEGAMVQVPRVSSLTGIPAAELEALVNEYTEGRDLGIFGEKRVNVLKLNLALMERKGL